jgi:hypothetical protein
MPFLPAAAAALLCQLATAAAPEPYAPLSGGSFSGPAVPLSPDPLVRYVYGASANLSAATDLLARVAPQAGSLTELLEAAEAVAREARAAHEARHGSWSGWARALASAPLANSQALERRVLDLSVRLAQAVGGLGAAIGVQTYEAVAGAARRQEAAAAAGAEQLGALRGLLAGQAAALDRAGGAAAASVVQVGSKLDRLLDMVKRLAQA